MLGTLNTAPLRLFLSYGHDSNEELVRLIKADLEARGHDVWFDQSHIKAGHDWRRAITDGIVDSNRVLSFLSKHSARDPGVCLDEIAIAIGVKGGNIQTVLVESEEEVTPPPSISHIQWLDMQDWKTWKAAGDEQWAQWYQHKFGDIVSVVESDESRLFAGEIKALADHLRPVESDFASDSRIRHLLAKELVGRRWLFKAVEEWRTKADASRLLWLTGEPGVGKSSFAAHLAHFYGRGTVIAAHFCDWQNPDRRDACSVIRTLAFQIATRLPDYRRLLLTLPQIGALDGKNAGALFGYLLVNALKLCVSGGRDRFVIVIDALDEAGENGRNELAEVLAKNVDLLPDWIRLVVTSRPEFDVTTPFQGLPPLPIERTSQFNRDDIREYLEATLGPSLRERDDAGNLVAQILDRSEGAFLYVERFCAGVREGSISLADPAQFPRGLGGVLHQYFLRQFPDDVRYRQVVAPVLRLLIAAREPLPLEVLRQQFQWHGEDVTAFTHALGSLFPVARQAGRHTIRPFHRSLTEWLVEPDRSGRFFCDAAEGGRQLAECGWHQFESNPADLTDYFRRHLARHLADAQRWDDLASLLESPALDILGSWIHNGVSDEGAVCLSGLIAHLRRTRRGTTAAGFATQLARIQSRLGRYDEAEAALRAALDDTSFWSGRRTGAIAFHELGSLSLYRQHYEQAEMFYRRALRRCEWGLPRYEDETGANLLGLAAVNQEQARFHEALVVAERARQISRKLGDVPHQLAALRLKALSFRGLGEYDAADAAISSALALIQQSTGVDHELPRVHNVRGWLAYDRCTIAGIGLDESIACFRSAAQGVRSSPNYYILAEAMLSLAWCSTASTHETDHGDLREFQRFPLVPDIHLGLWCGKHVLEAVSAYQSGDGNAARLYEEAIAFCEAHDNIAWRTRALVGLGTLLRETGNVDGGAAQWKVAHVIAHRASAGLGRVTDSEISAARLRATSNGPSSRSG